MKKAYLFVVILLTVLTLLSLMLNGVVIYALVQAQQTMHGIVSDAREMVSQLADHTFTYTVEVDQEFPISTEFPFSQTMTVPVNTVVPVNTKVVVPIDLGFTTYRLTVPVNTVFPVDMDFTIPVSQVVDITTVVPMSMALPVEIAVPETPLAGYLEEVDAMLERTQQVIEGPRWER